MNDNPKNKQETPLQNRIVQADCLDFLRSLPDESVDLVVTDPPYNVSAKSDLNCGRIRVRKNFGDWDKNFDPLPVIRELHRVLKPDGQAYVFCGTRQIPVYLEAFADGWTFRNLLVWHKTNPPPRIDRTNFLFANEYLVYAIKGNGRPSRVTFNFTTQSDMHNLFVTPSLQGRERLKGADGRALHPTQKPLSILKKLIAVSSNPGDLVLDPFAGVGSTAVACQELGRKWIGCEIDRRYLDASLRRLAESAATSDSNSRSNAATGESNSAEQEDRDAA